MLILSRRPLEGITIDSDIRIVVVSVKGNTVRLGIEAPGHVRILRDELINTHGDGDDDTHKRPNE